METDKPASNCCCGGRSLRLLRFAVIVLVVATLGCGAAYAYWDHVLHRFTTITPGSVYCSAAMPPDYLVKIVRKYGINTVIDFRNPGKEATDSTEAVLREEQALEVAGVRHVRVPSDQIPSNETVKRYLEVMSDPALRPVLMHCHHGEGRAVLFAAIYRIEFEHWEPDRARRATKCAILSGSTFAADGPKGRYLLAYKPMLPQATNATPQSTSLQ